MSHPQTSTTDEPIGALVHRLSEQIPELVRSEMRLAQAELSEKGKKAGLGIGMFSAAGLLAFLGLCVLITTAILALALVLPAWAAALLVAVVLLVGMTIAERLSLPWLHPGRADVIDAGALILSRVLHRTPVEELVVSESDILDGIAWSLV